MALSPDRIRGIYAKRRTKGQYTELLVEFLTSAQEGVSVREEWPQLFTWDASKPEGEQGKQASTLKQGFENAKGKKDFPLEGVDPEIVDVIVDGDDVFLINTELYNPAAEMAGVGAEDEA